MLIIVKRFRKKYTEINFYILNFYIVLYYFKKITLFFLAGCVLHRHRARGADQ